MNSTQDQNSAAVTDGEVVAPGQEQKGQPSTPQDQQQPQDKTGFSPVQSDVTVKTAADDQAQTDKPSTDKLGLVQGGNQVPTTPLPTEDPFLKKVSKINQAATLLTGGPHFTTTVDPVTGKITRTQNQPSTKSLLLAVAMEALGGAAAGLQQKGPGNEGKAFAAGFQSGAKDATAAAQGQDDQDKQATQDLARQAAVVNTNFTTRSNAMKLQGQDYDMHQEWVKNGAPIIENLRAAGAITASGVRESDLLTKYHVAKDMAVADGVVPHIGEDGKQDGWENTYSVIDPKAKISAPEETAKFLVDMRVPGAFTMKDGKAVSTLMDMQGGAQVNAGILADMMQKASSIQLTQGQFDQQFKTLNDPGDEKKFTTNLQRAIQDGSVTTKSMATISKYAALPLNQIADAMRKDKVDPSTIGSFLNLMPEGAIEKAKINQTNQEADAKALETRKNLVITPNNAQTVINAPKGDYTDAQITQAKGVLKGDVEHAASKAAAEASGRTQAEINTKVRNGISIPNQSRADAVFASPALTEASKQPPAPDGVNHAFLDLLAKTDQRAATVKAVGEGRNTLSAYALAKEYGGDFANLVNAAYPSWDQGRTEEYHTALKQFAPGGNLGKNVISINTALAHMSNALDNIGWTSTVPGVSNVARGLGIKDAAGYQAHMLNVAAEVATAYKGGIPTESEIKERYKALTGNPNSVKETMSAWAEDLQGKQEANFHQFDESVPSSFVAPVQFYDPQAAKSFARLTGRPVDPDLVGATRWRNNQNPNPNAGGPVMGPQKDAPHGATGTAPAGDGKMYYHDAKGNNLGLVPGQ